MPGYGKSHLRSLSCCMQSEINLWFVANRCFAALLRNITVPVDFAIVGKRAQMWCSQAGAELSHSEHKVSIPGCRRHI
jgi:Zn finger protein HypA/HybF involved in hydrogenase expression